MGSLSRHRAQERFREALDQRLQDNHSPSEMHSIYEEAVDELLTIGIDAEELNGAARRIAVDPDSIDFPD